MSGKKIISCNDLFPAIKDILRNGNQVWFTISGSSMNPWLIHHRDSVKLASVDVSELKTGDIILFCPRPDIYVLHRITKIVENGFITTGDGNLERDGYISKDSIVGKAVVIRRKGKLIECDRLMWRIVFRMWMLLFPIRKFLLELVRGISKFKTFIKHFVKKC